MNQDTDVVCLSHRRFGPTYGRANHLMMRFARERRTFFVEEPLFDVDEAQLELRPVNDNLIVMTPHLPASDALHDTVAQQREMLERLLADFDVRRPLLWFYSPAALAFAPVDDAFLTVYDCIEERPAFEAHEATLLERADVVFTAGHGLWDAKRSLRPRVYPFASSVDAAHFARARATREDPADQASIARPRIGFYGTIDARIDLDLVARIADARPSWQLVMLGPVTVEERLLPRRANVHYLGAKAYAELPSYLAGWDAAMLPYHVDASTRFVSATKALEPLAAGKPVVSTSLPEVMPFGEHGAVRIASADTFVAHVEEAIRARGDSRFEAGDALVARTSWDQTFRQMSALVYDTALAKKERALESARFGMALSIGGDVASAVTREQA